MGAIPRDADTVRVLVRLDFEKRSVYNVYLWGPQRILGLRGTPALPALKYLPTSDNEFAAFSLDGASRPHVAFLGRIPGTRRFSDRERHPNSELSPGILIFRPESGLIYLNVDHVRDTIAERVREESAPPKPVIIDLSAAPYVDLQSAHTLAGLAAELKAEGIRVQVVEPYLELHTGPGSGYPITQVIERGEWVKILKRRTDWF